MFLSRESVFLSKVLMIFSACLALSACGGGGSTENAASASSSSSTQSLSSAASSGALTSSSSAAAQSSASQASSVSSGGGSSSSSSSSVLAADDFTQGLSLWQVEQENAAGTVVAANGELDIVQPAGATLWFKQKFSGDYEIHFTATPIPYTVTVSGKTYTDRISDLNMFWNATVPTGSDPDPTKLGLDGKLASYNPLALYYVGFGANSNTTTRLRRYDGTATRPQITGYATAASKTVDDTAGDMTAATSLVANAPVRVRVVSRAATASDPATLLWYANDNLIFSYADPAPILSGWFGFRTTVSHWKLSAFSVIAR